MLQQMYGKQLYQETDATLSSLTTSFTIYTFSICLPFLYPCHQHISSPTPPPSMSCLDPSLFHVPEESGVRLPFYFFTMSEPQAAHATSTRPLMPPDQEQVVNIIPFEGFSNAGCTLCEEAKCGGKWLRFKDCVGKQPTLGNYGIKHTLDALFLFSFSYTPTHSPTHKYNAYHTCCLVKQDLCCTCLGRIDYPCQMRTT